VKKSEESLKCAVSVTQLSERSHLGTPDNGSAKTACTASREEASEFDEVGTCQK
jgi:hypothetical protein